DLHSTNGTRVAGHVVHGQTAVADGDIIRFGGMHAAVRRRRRDRSVAASASPASGRIRFNRPPRAPLPPPPEAVAVPPAAPAPAPGVRFGWAAVVAPLVLGLAMAAVFGPLMAAFAVFSPGMVVSYWWDERRRVRMVGRHAQ